MRNGIDERWNEDEIREEVRCYTCGIWHAKFDAYPRLALCPNRSIKKHRRNEIRYLPLIVNPVHPLMEVL